MTEKKFSVCFEPGHRVINGQKGDSLLDLAIIAGTGLCASCGGEGVCGRCRIKLIEGELECEDHLQISAEEFAQGIRLACQSRLVSNVTVEILAESRFDTAISGDAISCTLQSRPESVKNKPVLPLRKVFLKLVPPSGADNSSDLGRLKRFLKPFCPTEPDIDYHLLSSLSETLREKNWKITVSLLETPNGVKIINIQPGDQTLTTYAFAFDIGTTGVRGQLLEVTKSQVLAQATEYNGQIPFGEDVISRINYAAREGGLNQLQQAVVNTLNNLGQAMLSECGLEASDIAFATIAANTTITQLLYGLDPKHLRLAPYVPLASELPLIPARHINLSICPQAYIYTLPCVASYVGGDIVAGVISTNIPHREGLVLYIDIGTNGEIVVGNKDFMLTASCSAGPAFEGGGIKNGMLAKPGAIEDIELGPQSFEPKLSVMGSGNPKGICGAGLINTVSALLNCGLLGQNGKYNTHIKTGRLRKGADGYEYVLAFGREFGQGQDITLSEVDIDNLIRAKAAMYAGYQTLLENAGANFKNLEKVIIAGTFGAKLNIKKAINIGLLPELPEEHFIFVSNGSLAGARLCAFDKNAQTEASAAAKMMTNVELSESVSFMDNYMASMFLPHTKSTDFPEVYAALGKFNGGRI
ncbi:(2Fe-2S)-binding protein [Dehalococcoides mccartyi]|uniref:ASKHA domain-containing protein n=1 Tax=Dehalococcoides mccartyi TaxID=61435 RepID=UPI00071DB74B|nr:ASKHA domain-containing protein [Dehalococcoides mccartyi]KSV16934.1 (2Fe-2S)-binding protein [Dehalococcoides mccartyi]